MTDTAIDEQSHENGETKCMPPAFALVDYASEDDDDD